MSSALELQSLYQGILEMEQCTWIEVGTLLPRDSPNATKWTSQQKDQASRRYDDAVNKYLLKYSEFANLAPSSDVNEANERIIARTAELKDARNRLKSASDTADAIASFLEVIDFVISLIAPLGFDSPQINVLNTFATLPAGDVDQELPYTHLIDIVSNSYLLASLSNTAEIDRMLIHGYALRLHRSILVISSLGYSHATMQFVARVTEIADRIQALLQVRGSISQAPQDLKDLMEACEAVVVYHP